MNKLYYKPEGHWFAIVCHLEREVNFTCIIGIHAKLVHSVNLSGWALVTTSDFVNYEDFGES